MGKPFKVTAEGRTFYLCCKAARTRFKADPKKFIAKLDETETRSEASTPIDGVERVPQGRHRRARVKSAGKRDRDRSPNDSGPRRSFTMSPWSGLRRTPRSCRRLLVTSSG